MFLLSEKLNIQIEMFTKTDKDGVRRIAWRFGIYYHSRKLLNKAAL